MARLKRHHHVRNPPSDDEISNSVASGDNAIDGGAGAEPHSPARSVSDPDIEGTPPSPPVSGFIIQPILSAIPLEDSVGKPKRSSAMSGSKRLREHYGGEVKVTKKKKKKKKSSSSAAEVTPKPVAGEGDEVIKKNSGAIQRFWSEEDGVAILKGMIEFRAKTGSEPSSDAAAFLDFIKGSIHVEASKSQLMSKMRKLKSKFRVNSLKFEKGEDLVFNKSHDSIAFELSKKIWCKAASDEETMIQSNGTDSRKKAKKVRSHKETSDPVLPETVTERSLTLGLRSKDANAKRNQKMANLEPENGVGVEHQEVANLEPENGIGVDHQELANLEAENSVGVERQKMTNLEPENWVWVNPMKPRGDIEYLADAAVAAAAAEANLNAKVVDDRIEVVVEKECNVKRKGGSDEASEDHNEMIVENGGSDEAVDRGTECNGKEMGISDEALEDQNEIVVGNGFNGKENGSSDEAVDSGKECDGIELGGSDEASEDQNEMVVEKGGFNRKENGSSDQAMYELIDTVVEKICVGKENGGSGGAIQAKSNAEVVDGRIEMAIDKVYDEKENNGRRGGAADTVWARYPYLKDALETILAHGMMGEFQKRMLLGKEGVFEGEKGEELNDQWKAFRYEETQLQVKKHTLMAKFLGVAVDELNK